jgi:hypothetical protein
MTKREVIYFEKAGVVNTEACIEVVKRVVSEEGINHVVVASTFGHVF